MVLDRACAIESIVRQKTVIRHSAYLMTEQLGDQVFDTSVELLEALGDQVFDDGLLKDIPILGTAVNLARLRKTIADRLFLKKVEKFLVSLSEVEETKKQKFYDRLETDQRLREKTGEVIVLILNRFDDLEKPEILARVFRSYMNGIIGFNQFRQLASAVDIAYIEDLWQLVNSKGRSPTDVQDSRQGLLRTGLTAISQHGVPVHGGFGENVVYSPIITTNLGGLFIKIMTGEASA